MQEVSRLEASGVQLFSATENLDTTTPMGWAVMGIYFAKARESSDRLSINVGRAWEAKAVRGEPHVTSRRPYGYEFSKTRSGADTLKQVPAEVRVAKQIVRRLLKGDTLNSVSTWLNNAGHLTAKGKRWTRGSVHQWVCAPSICGLRSHKGEMTEGNWTGIITPEGARCLADPVG